MSANTEDLDDWPHLPGLYHRDIGPDMPDIAIDDWDVLCAAVEVRLGQVVDAPRMALVAGEGAVLLRGIRADVLECVEALAQLRAAQAHQRAVGRSVACALADAELTVAALRAELAGTRAAEQRASHQALHDSLTSLPNRAWFRARVERAITDAQPTGQSLAVMYIDLDGFKHINDTHGHEIGDEMLRIVAARLTRAMRANDVVSRQGGDE
jgi:hypothetical protein